MGQPPIRRTESHHQASSGRRLRRRAWLPADPRRWLLIVHGLAEHSGRYDHVCSWCARRGFAVHAYDQAGHGESEGRRGHIDRFSELHDDLADMLALVASEHPGPPGVLIGHSMGGLVVASFLSERSPPLLAAITSGAALAVSPDLSPVKRSLAKLVRRVLPRLALATGLRSDGLSRDPLVIRRYEEDPLVLTRITASLGAEVLAAVSACRARGRSVRVPLLMLHGADDPICLPSGSEAFFAGLPRAEVLGSELQIYPRLRHEIFNEPEQESVFQDMLCWIEAREAAVGE